MIEDYYWIWISRLEYMDFRTLQRLLQDYGSIKRIMESKREEILMKDYLSNYLKKKIFDFSLRKDLDKYLSYIEKNNIKIISYQDKDYPVKLHDIDDKPIVLYVKGNIKCINEDSVRYSRC